MSSFTSFNPYDLTTRERHGHMLSAIAPRPIAFVSTMGIDGSINLAPYSFFNAFGSNPPTLIFSPSRRVRDNSLKDTLRNVKEVKECVVNIVNFKMVEQMSLASAGFEYGVSEFEKAGFAEIPSETVRPPRAKEAPVQFECKVKEVIETGKDGGAGNLVVCEITKIHIQNDVMTDGKIDIRKIDLVGRMGGNWYVRASNDALFELPGLKDAKVIGIDALPERIRTSERLTGNQLARLGSLPHLPSKEALKQFEQHPDTQLMFKRFQHNDQAHNEHLLLNSVEEYMISNQIEEALMLLMLYYKVPAAV